MENLIFYTNSYDDIIESMSVICGCSVDSIKKWLQ